MKPAKPFGRDETRTALLDAADYLFGEKGPNAVTVREISARANVNHALLHRHFGSKEALLSAIIEQHMQQFKRDFAQAKDLEQAIADVLRSLIQRPAFTRIVAHLILDHRPFDEFARRSGTAADMASALIRHGVEPDAARKLAAIVASFSLGWSLFKGFSAFAASCEASEDESDELAARILQSMVKTILATQTGP
jgi:TetR/AcrR family transcriptional regulator, repressor for neighboring sulfatase